MMDSNKPIGKAIINGGAGGYGAGNSYHWVYPTPYGQVTTYPDRTGEIAALQATIEAQKATIAALNKLIDLLEDK